MTSMSILNVDVNHTLSPIMTQGNLGHNRYKAEVVQRTINRTKTENEMVKMSVRNARINGYGNIIEGTPSEDTIINLEIPKTMYSQAVETITLVTDLKHRYRSSKAKTVRPEYLDASKNPEYYLPKWLKSHVETDINHYKFTDLDDITFFVIVKLGLTDTPCGNKTWTTRTDECFYVISSDENDFVVVDGNGDKHILSLSEEAAQQSLVRNFIMFLHSDCVIS